MTLPMPFDNPDTYPGHSGVDFGQPMWTAIRASGPGSVFGPAYNDRCGFGVWISYDGYPDVLYCHMPSHDGVPPRGTRINEGDVIGYVGSTGNSSGPHAHVEVENHATTAGFWEFFDPNRVVGQSGGGSSPILEPNQRRAGANGVRARREPNTSSEIVDASFLAEGEVGTFKGYVVGEDIDGINAWAVGFYSGLYFWMGGLEPMNLDGLENLTPTAPPAIGPAQRRATAGGTRGRADATTASAEVTFLNEGEVGDFNGWKHDQSVEGEDRWIRGAYSGAWFWLGGLEPRNVDGLADLNGSTTPPVDPPPTDGRIIYPQPAAPTYPGAVKWAHSSKCDPRKAGSKIQVLILHGWGKFPNNQAEEWDYFTGWQGADNGSSPTWQSNADGSIYEVVPPDGYRPWTTGQIDHQAVTIEAQPTSGNASGTSDDPTRDYLYSAAQYEAWSQILVWAHDRYGIPLQLAEITGTGKDSTIVKGGLTSHKLTPAGKESKTVCPGPSLDLNRVITRAKEIAAGTPPVTPPGDDVTITREWVSRWRVLAEQEIALLDELLRK